MSFFGADCEADKTEGGMTMKDGGKARMAVLGVLFALSLCARAKDARSAPVAGSDIKELPRGYREVTIVADPAQLYFVNKGDRVDVLTTFDALMKGGIKEKVTATILQNVIVADVHKPADLEKAGAVSLLLNPNEAQYAALSSIQGSIQLLVRAPGDMKMHPMEMASFRKLTHADVPREALLPPKTGTREDKLVEGYRGVFLEVSGHQLLFVNKGDRVDVLATVELDMDKIKEKVTAAVLQNVAVLDVYRPEDPKEKGIIELLLKPEDAQYAALSGIQGTIHFAVRSPEDLEIHSMNMASFRRLFR